MTDDQLIRQVLQGGGNMPAFGKSLTPPQTTALVAFLRSMNGDSGLRRAEAPAMQLGRDGSRLPYADHGDPALDLPETPQR